MSLKKEESIINEFKQYLEFERGLSQNSIFSYISDITKLDRFLNKDKKNIVESTHQDITNFLREENRRKISNRTKARVIASLRQFYNYLEHLKLIVTNPMEKVESPKLEKHIPDFLTQKEIKKLFNVFDTDNYLELRDKAMFELLYSSGLRISEACNLKISDVDMKEKVIHVHGKGDNIRLVPLGEVAMDILQTYFKKSRSIILGSNYSDNIFVSKKGSALNRKSAWRLLKKYIDRAMIHKNITPHTLRHSFATHLLQNNADLRSVQELLGHIDISTTQIYTHVAHIHLQKSHKKHHPRS